MSRSEQNWSGATLDAALQRRPPGRHVALAAPASPAEGLAGQASALLDTLSGLAPSDWARPAAPYPWTVHELAAHLLAVARYAGEVLDGTADGTDPAAPHLEMSEPTIAVERQREPDATLADLAAALEATVSLAAGLDDAARASTVTPHGVPMHAADYLVVLTFELWTHADDIRAACGSGLVAPPPEVLHTMADLSVRSLPLLALVVPVVSPPADVHVVLTGEGGGAWDIHMGELAGGGVGTGGDVELVADVVDYCRMVAGRIAPFDLDAEVDGDPVVVTALFDAARAIAV